MKRTIGIMGFGRFGQFMAAHLSPRFDVIAGSRSDHAAEAEALGVEWAPLQTAAEQDCVIVSVSISTLHDVLRSFAPSFSRGALVCDVSSVKVYPCSLLDAYVPEGCHCLGTHPLFGPDTARAGLAGHTIALCPLRGYDPGPIASTLTDMGLEVIQTTPDEHDRNMARSLALIHFMGSALSGLGIGDVTLATATHRRLCELVSITHNDSPQLLLDMHRYNPYAAGVRRKLIDRLVRLDGELSSLEAEGMEH